MLRKQLIGLGLTASLAFAAPGFASARTFQPDGKRPSFHAGIVTSSGGIAAGTGFSVSHDGVGQYTIDYPVGTFKSCPAINVTASGIASLLPIANVYSYAVCSAGEVKVQIRMYARSDGALEDNSFHFVMNET